MTVGRVADIRAQGPDPSQGRTGHIVAVTFVPDDARTFTAMTAAAARAQPPANRIAIVAEGRVLSAPAVAEPISGGTVQISGPPATFTRDYTEGLVRRITGG
jgi:preprotein translocase subunit SecD